MHIVHDDSPEVTIPRGRTATSPHFAERYAADPMSAVAAELGLPPVFWPLLLVLPLADRKDQARYLQPSDHAPAGVFIVNESVPEWGREQLKAELFAYLHGRPDLAPHVHPARGALSVVPIGG